MIVLPAVDLRDGACVQLVGGDYAEERVRLADPVGVARGWTEMGFSELHVVDLDAATGKGANTEIAERIVRETRGGVQVGGGVRSLDAIGRLAEAGARRVVVGTRAVEAPRWLDEATEAYPDFLVVAADVHNRRIVTRGWLYALPASIDDVVGRLSALPLAGVLVTAVHREGQMQGTDLELFDDVVRASRLPVYASGGITTVDDLRALRERGVAGAIIGMALYTGALDARAVAQEFGGRQ